MIIPRDARLNRHENALVVTSDAGRKSIPLQGVKHVLCMGDGSISIRLLKDMGRRGIPLYGPRCRREDSWVHSNRRTKPRPDEFALVKPSSFWMTTLAYVSPKQS